MDIPEMFADEVESDTVKVNVSVSAGAGGGADRIGVGRAPGDVPASLCDPARSETRLDSFNIDIFRAKVIRVECQVDGDHRRSRR